MKIIFKTISRAIVEIKEKNQQMKVFILDGYSCVYDEDNILDNIKAYT